MDQDDCTALPKLADVCRDDIEILAMSISRFIAAGYMTSDVACWDAGHDLAERKLGPIAGPRLVASMASVIRALRAERIEPWHFMPANCCRVTRDELELVKLLSLGRTGSKTLINAAARLTGRTAQRLVEAVLAATEALNAHQTSASAVQLRQSDTMLH
jgi:hypothetical protein